MIPNMIAQTEIVEVATPEIAWSLFMPLLIIALGGILLITVTSVVPRLRTGGIPAGFTILTAGVAAWFLKPIWERVSEDGPQSIVANALAIDRMTIFVWGLLCLAVFFVGALLDGYLRRENFDGPEWYVLMLMSASGGMIMAAAQDLILLFLGLEILSIAVYVLAGLHLRRSNSQEAAFKYFILGAVASALFLYGIALIYGATGSTSINVIAGARAPNGLGLNPVEDSSMILVGMALMLIGFAFKVSAVPFHSWTPDVYEGAPTPIVAFMASAVKIAGFAGMVRVFWDGLGYYAADWSPLLAFMAAASLIVGAFLALVQTNVKRMLAYSSITHAGFIMVAFYSLSGGSKGLSSPDSLLSSVAGAEAFLFYLLAYTLMALGTFGVLTVIGGQGDGDFNVSDLQGLGRSQPVLAGLLAILLFAQAGVPFTAGFAAKIRVILAATNSGSYLIAGIAMVAAVVSAVLYLRIVVSMFMIDDVAYAADDTAVTDGSDEVSDDADSALAEAIGSVRSHEGLYIPRPAFVAIAILAISTIVLGILPVGQGVLREAAVHLAFLRQLGN